MYPLAPSRQTIRWPDFSGDLVERLGELNMGCGRLQVACDDGFQVATKDTKELVALTQWHVEHAHNKKVSHDEVMKMAKHP